MTKTDREIESLVRTYYKARERLLKIITNPSTGVGTKTYYTEILRGLQRELGGLKEKTDGFVQTVIPSEYRASLKDTVQHFKRHNLRMDAPANFASIHTDALYTIMRDMQYRTDDALATVGRKVTNQLDDALNQTLRRAGLEQTALKTASGGTVRDMQRALAEQLERDGFMTIDYGAAPNIRRVPIDAYAAMTARSTTREAGNTARIVQLSENGYDLVKLTEHFPTCKVCAAAQGRVYSISGTDTRFPPLSKIFGAYNNVHPNCRHVATPWIESMMTPSEVYEARQQSGRPWKDSRNAGEIALYKAQQDKARRSRENVYQYERYKSVLGADAPKTLQTFMRLKNADGDKWDKTQLDYRRRNRAIRDPKLLPTNADKAYSKPEKFTNYFFGGENKGGLSKGLAFSSHLGYNINNWEQMRDEITSKARLFPAKIHKKTSQGTDLYNQSMTLYGVKNNPMDVIVTWEAESDKLKFVTAVPNNKGVET